VGLAIIAAPVTANAAMSFNSLLEKALGMAAKDPKKFCQKGSFWKKVYSVRSLEGLLCTNKTIYAAAVAVCGTNNIEGFNGSKCDQKGKKVAGSAGIGSILKDTLPAATSSTKKLVCTQKPMILESAPDAAPVLDKVCG
ncbi:MAG TPA: hypothetical protein DD412_00060, partial [Holosporales bacterium]|nr:hypothetical protein [Holosporales bacterium]